MPLKSAIPQGPELGHAFDEREHIRPEVFRYLFDFTPASSIVSCRSPACDGLRPGPASARRKPTSAVCVKYGSPE